MKVLNEEEVKNLKVVNKGESFEINDLTHNIEVYGELKVHNTLDDGSVVDANDGSTVYANYGSTVYANYGSTVYANDGSTVYANYGSVVYAYNGSRVDAYDCSRVYAYDGSRVDAYNGSRVCASNGSGVDAYDGSRVDANYGSVVYANDGSRVDAYDGSRVDAYNGVIYIRSEQCTVRASGNTVIIRNGGNADIKCVGNVVIQYIKDDLKFFERHYIEIQDNKCVLYKKVSKEYKTQEGTPNETLWGIGSTVEHPEWHPKESECGEGKFHAVAMPFWADEFRDEEGDRYIAIEIDKDDLCEWDNPCYPHKIAFRKGKILYECDRFGRKLI